MNPSELLRIVDSLHREKSIDPEIVFQAIEAALVSAAKRQYGEDSDIEVKVVRDGGKISASCNGEPLDPEEMIGRIGAQSAKQVIIQKIREAERDSLIEEFQEQIGQLVNGVVQRNEGGATTVSLGNVEAILPKSEQIPGETHHPNERVRAIVHEVRPQGSRVKVVLSRTHPNLVRRLFEQEIPEIADGVITVNNMAREAGQRSKVAVSSSDSRVDCVGACVGVRGNRIKNIINELDGERIDIVRWDDDPEVLIPNALQPAEVDQVLLCGMIGRAIVLVREDQLSLAIGRRGQNVRLASKLCGWDIEIMTAEELEEQIDRAVAGFSGLEGVSEELAHRLVEQGYLSYDDLSVIEPEHLMELGGLEEDEVDRVVEQAEVKAEEAEKAAAEARQRQREAERREAAQAKAEPPVAAKAAVAKAAPEIAETAEAKTAEAEASEVEAEVEAEAEAEAEVSEAEAEAEAEASEAQAEARELGAGVESDAEGDSQEANGGELEAPPSQELESTASATEQADPSSGDGKSSVSES